MAHHPGITLKPLVKLPRDPSDCWEWQGRIDEAGYSRKVHRNVDMTGARWMWEVLWGSVPDSLVVSTTCGNRTCCNPHHLEARTQAQANRAGVAATLTPQDVAMVKRAKKDRGPNTAKVLAEQLGVNPGAIREIWRGATWGRRKRVGQYKPKGIAA